MKPVSRTAFYCCGVRMADAERPHPVCGDQYAKLFMSDEGRALYARFAGEVNPNGSNVTRHRIIDDLLRQRLLEDPARPILVIGAGFDSRAFRLSGGRWTEVDEEALIAWKNERLPAGRAPNPLERVAVDLSRDWLPDLVDRYRNASRVTVVIEGVLMYLEEPQVVSLLRGLRRLPRHEIICDLMRLRFFQRYSQTLHDQLEALGTRFRYLTPDPDAAFLEAGYRRTAQVSIVKRAAELKAIPVPRLLVSTVLGTLRRGYQVEVFDSTAA